MYSSLGVGSCILKMQNKSISDTLSQKTIITIQDVHKHVRPNGFWGEGGKGPLDQKTLNIKIVK